MESKPLYEVLKQEPSKYRICLEGTEDDKATKEDTGNMRNSEIQTSDE